MPRPSIPILHNSPYKEYLYLREGKSNWRLKNTLAPSRFAILSQYYSANHTTKHELGKGHTECIGKMRNVYITRTPKNRHNYELISVNGRILERTVRQDMMCRLASSGLMQGPRWGLTNSNEFCVYKFRGILDWLTTVLLREASVSSGQSGSRCARTAHFRNCIQRYETLKCVHFLI
jgi:hypothetical protein